MTAPPFFNPGEALFHLGLQIDDAPGELVFFEDEGAALGSEGGDQRLGVEQFLRAAQRFFLSFGQVLIAHLDLQLG